MMMRELRDSLVRIETRLDGLADKEDLHRAMKAQSWRIIGAMLAVVGMALAAFAPIAHAQVYKCMDGGRTVFSDQPCPGAVELNVRPASGAAPQQRQPDGDGPTRVEAVPTSATAEAPRTISMVDRASNLAKRRQLKDAIDRKTVDVKKLEDEMNARIAYLRSQRRYARNNLAGATWQNSLAEEMNAVSESYSTQIAGVRSEIDRMRAERDAIPE